MYIVEYLSHKAILCHAAVGDKDSLSTLINALDDSACVIFWCIQNYSLKTLGFAPKEEWRKAREYV